MILRTRRDHEISFVPDHARTQPLIIPNPFNLQTTFVHLNDGMEKTWTYRWFLRLPLVVVWALVVWVYVRNLAEHRVVSPKHGNCCFSSFLLVFHAVFFSFSADFNKITLLFALSAPCMLFNGIFFFIYPLHHTFSSQLSPFFWSSPAIPLLGSWIPIRNIGTFVLSLKWSG